MIDYKGTPFEARDIRPTRPADYVPKPRQYRKRLPSVGEQINSMRALFALRDALAASLAADDKPTTD
jgi:hypothetical protein